MDKSKANERYMVPDMEKNVNLSNEANIPFFSIIIPIYNAEKYIKRCAESIDKQSFNDYEVFFIDDSSEDSSSAICIELAQKNGKIQYCKKTHGGAAAARNYGIVKASGSYIVFIDADDYVAEQFLEKLRESIADKEFPDICFLNSHYVVDKGKINKNVIFRIPQTQDLSNGLSQKEFIDLVTFETNILPGSMWLAVFRKDFLLQNNLQFDEKLIWSEDSDFIYRALIKAEKIKCCNYCGYYYYLDNSKSVSKKFSLEKAMGRMDVYSKWALYFENDPDAKKKYSERARKALVQQLLSEYCEFLNVYMKIENREEKKCLYKRLKAERKLWKQCKNYKYRDYVEYGIVLGALIQNLKRQIKRILKITP